MDARTARKEHESKFIQTRISHSGGGKAIANVICSDFIYCGKSTLLGVLTEWLGCWMWCFPVTNGSTHIFLLLQGDKSLWAGTVFFIYFFLHLWVTFPQKHLLRVDYVPADSRALWAGPHCQAHSHLCAAMHMEAANFRDTPLATLIPVRARDQHLAHSQPSIVGPNHRGWFSEKALPSERMPHWVGVEKVSFFV